MNSLQAGLGRKESHERKHNSGLAIGTIAALYIEFYKIPVGEPEDKKPAEESEKKD